MARFRTAGFTVIEVLLGLLLITIAALIVPSIGYVRRQGDAVGMNSEAEKLNRAVTVYIHSGGSILPADSATSVLAKIQTPVDATTYQAIGAIAGEVPPNYDLQPYSAADGLARLVWSGTNFVVQTSGVGYRPVMLAGAGKHLGTQSITTTGEEYGPNWVWAYQDAAVPGSNTPPVLNISGPQVITTPGNYSWNINSTESGPLSITLNNAQTMTGTGTNVSASEAFNFGDSLTFVVVGSYTPSDKTSAQTVLLPVTVSIPVTALNVTYGREDGSSSTNFTYAQVSDPSGPPATRDGIVLSVPGSPANVSIYYTYDGSTPSTSSNLYSGPFHVPLSGWSSSVPLKAIAVSTSGTLGANVTGPVLAVALIPTQVTLSPPTFSPSPSVMVAQGTPITIVPANPITDSTRTAVGGAAPTPISSDATSILLPSD